MNACQVSCTKKHKRVQQECVQSRTSSKRSSKILPQLHQTSLVKCDQLGIRTSIDSKGATTLDWIAPLGSKKESITVTFFAGPSYAFMRGVARDTKRISPVPCFQKKGAPTSWKSRRSTTFAQTSHMKTRQGNLLVHVNEPHQEYHYSTHRHPRLHYFAKHNPHCSRSCREARIIQSHCFPIRPVERTWWVRNHMRLKTSLSLLLLLAPLKVILK